MVFHVTTRSNAGEHIFRDDDDYRAGVRIIAKLVRQGFLKCHGFCLMPTHYHVLASFPEDGLRPAVQRLNRRYASFFNERYGRHGHVFGSRYRAVAVERDEHGDWLPHYIAENPPVRPWRWSSYDAVSLRRTAAVAQMKLFRGHVRDGHVPETVSSHSPSQ